MLPVFMVAGLPEIRNKAVTDLATPRNLSVAPFLVPSVREKVWFGELPLHGMFYLMYVWI